MFRAITLSGLHDSQPAVPGQGIISASIPMTVLLSGTLLLKACLLQWIVIPVMSTGRMQPGPEDPSQEQRQAPSVWVSRWLCYKPLQQFLGLCVSVWDDLSLLHLFFLQSGFISKSVSPLHVSSIGKLSKEQNSSNSKQIKCVKHDNPHIPQVLFSQMLRESAVTPLSINSSEWQN